MIQEELSNRYFEWLYHLVCGDDIYGRVSYRKLLIFLHKTEFTYIHEMDENRVHDGINFRYRFGYENGYSRNIIKKYLDTKPCSVLEMMIALAFRAEEQIMDDFDYGDRTGQWFWNMVVSLGLNSMSDQYFNGNYAYQVISKFLERRYEPNGKGGLFTIENSRQDLRDVEIWAQCMWYLDEVIYSK